MRRKRRRRKRSKRRRRNRMKRSTIFHKKYYSGWNGWVGLGSGENKINSAKLDLGISLAKSNV